MPVEGFLDTRGRQYLGIGICDRCKRKFPLDELWTDRNNPGLKVCKQDIDEYDPWRLPVPEGEQVALMYPRPDEGLS